MAPLRPAHASADGRLNSMLPSLGFDIVSLRPAVVDALMVMERSYRLPLGLSNVAAAVAVSPRRLQEVFREDTGETPMNALRRIRLLHARQDLLDPTEQRSIGQIAVDAQILHVGRFSASYAAAFGESPSVTIARVRSTRQLPLNEPRRGHFDVQTMEYRDR